MESKEQYSIDPLDKHILYWLDQDCRMGVPALAKKARASPARVRYHLRRLVDCGAIRHFVAVINYRMLGLRSHTVCYKLRGLGPDEITRISMPIASDPRVVGVSLNEGAFDLRVTFLSYNFDGASEMMWFLRERLDRYILEEQWSTALSSQLIPRDVLLPHPSGGREKPLPIMGHDLLPLDISEEDQRLLVAIADHAEWPVWKVAGAAGLSGPAAYSRLRALEKKGAIKQYGIILDPNLPGYHQYRVFAKLRHANVKRRQELESFLAAIPSVHRSTFLFGAYDLYYDVMAPNDEALREVTTSMYRKFPDEIVRQDWVRTYDILKFRFYPSSVYPSPWRPNVYGMESPAIASARKKGSRKH